MKSLSFYLAISDCCLDSIHRVSATLNDTNKIPVTYKEEVIIITLFLCCSSLIKSRSIFSRMLRQCITILQYAACLFQVQGHAGLRALVLPRTMVESIEPNVLRIMPLLLQCRGDASLSMVSITFIGLARGECTFKSDVIPTLEMHFDLSHTAAFPYFVFRYRAHYSPFRDELISYFFFFFYFLLCNLFSSL